jgi:hypothetical protein
MDTSDQVQPGWYPDPAARFEVRYHNGRMWTADVSTNGERFVDPLGTRPGQPAAMSPGPVGVAPTGKNGAATASMVLGIISIGVGWLPFIVVIGAMCAVTALALGIVGRKRAKHSRVGGGFATAGLVTGAVGCLVCVVGIVFSVAMVRAIDDYDNPGDHVVALTGCERDADTVVATGELTNTGDSTESFSVRVFFVRPGTDNAQRQATALIDDVAPGATATFEVARHVVLDEIDCIVGEVRGPFPFGVDPGT